MTWNLTTSIGFSLRTRQIRNDSGPVLDDAFIEVFDDDDVIVNDDDDDDDDDVIANDDVNEEEEEERRVEGEVGKRNGERDLNEEEW